MKIVGFALIVIGCLQIASGLLTHFAPISIKIGQNIYGLEMKGATSAAWIAAIIGLAFIAGGLHLVRRTRKPRP